MIDWKKYQVECAECGAQLSRRLFRPKDGKRIARFFCDGRCKGIWQQAHNKPVGEAWLRQKYLVERLDCAQIAVIVRRDPKSVWNWLRGYGIPTRGRGNPQNLVPMRAGLFRHSEAAKHKLREARIADGRYPKQADGRPYWAGKKGEQHPSWRGGSTPERQEFYGSPEWRAARKAAYANARGKCQRCGSKEHLHVHHVMPFVVGRRRADPSNLKVLCAPCHRFVHSPANGEREFLPPFASFPVERNGKVRLVPISYFPKMKARIPSWL